MTGAIIQETLAHNDNLLNVSALCEIADVSRSGYYHYLSTEELRLKREKQDQEDFLLIVEAYQHRGYDKGARGIYMRLLHLEPPCYYEYKKDSKANEEVWAQVPCPQSKSI